MEGLVESWTEEVEMADDGKGERAGRGGETAAFSGEEEEEEDGGEEEEGGVECDF